MKVTEQIDAMEASGTNPLNTVRTGDAPLMLLVLVLLMMLSRSMDHTYVNISDYQLVPSGIWFC
jgi:ABC-type transporter Mla maintaining outer membrane lipid asymmetry permease subunit MlaE